MTNEAVITIVGRMAPSDPVHELLLDAVVHAELGLGVCLNTRWLDLDELDELESAFRGTAAAVLAPGRQTETRELRHELLGAISGLRARRVPTLAVEDGFNHLLIEWARNVIGKKDAGARAYDERAGLAVIDRFIEKPHKLVDTRRIETVEIEIERGTLLHDVYGVDKVRESSRATDAPSGDYAAEFAASGMIASARARQGERCVIAAMEATNLPFFVGVSFLPQLRTRQGSPHPLFARLIREALRDK